MSEQKRQMTFRHLLIQDGLRVVSMPDKDTKHIAAKIFDLGRHDTELLSYQYAARDRLLHYAEHLNAGLNGNADPRRCLEAIQTLWEATT